VQDRTAHAQPDTTQFNTQLATVRQEDAAIALGLPVGTVRPRPVHGHDARGAARLDTSPVV
jgi:hypothetical protein